MNFRDFIGSFILKVIQKRNPCNADLSMWSHKMKYDDGEMMKTWDEISDCRGEKMCNWCGRHRKKQ